MARLVVGRIRGQHGLGGAVRVEVLTDDEARFAPGGVLYVEGEARRLTVAWSQADKPGLLVRFARLTTREAVAGLLGRYLEAEVDAAALPEGSYYWHELPGSTVTASDGEELGTATDVFRAGGGEVLVVTGGPRGEVLVPLVRSVVLEFAPREQRVVVDAAALDLAPLRPRRPRGRRSSKLGPGTVPTRVPPDGEVAVAAAPDGEMAMPTVPDGEMDVPPVPDRDEATPPPGEGSAAATSPLERS
ncbi:MAG: ribosome maturation factor RimM [Candidatus Limnocylindrales bacterium]